MKNMNHSPDAGSAREQTAKGGHEHRRLQEEHEVRGAHCAGHEASFCSDFPGRYL